MRYINRLFTLLYFTLLPRYFYCGNTTLFLPLPLFYRKVFTIPRYYREIFLIYCGYRGITTFPITVSLST